MPLVVVDAGHGGRDPGTVGNGLQEKDITLAQAFALQSALERSGIQVIMTRTTDSIVLQNGTIGQDLSARADIANRNNADLFISWHVDSFSNPEVNGVAAWVYPSTLGTKTETIAQLLVNDITAATGQLNRGVYTADFEVLRETNMDAVLIESGFITNSYEASHLSNPDFRKAQAEAVATAICEYFRFPYVAPEKPAPAPEPSPTSAPEPSPAPSPVPTPSPAPDPFPGETLPDWAKQAILRVYKAGIMTGYEDGTFRADNPVTRAELAVALVRFYDLIREGRSM